MDAHADAPANEMDESPVAQADEGLAPGVPGNHEPARAIAWRRHGTDGFLGDDACRQGTRQRIAAELELDG